MDNEISLSLDTTDRLRVFRLRLNVPFTHEQLLAELENEAWVPPVETSMYPGHEWTAVRFKCCPPSPHSTLLNKLNYFFSIDSTKRQLVDLMFKHIPGFDVDYMMSAEELASCTILHGEFTKDMPGFVNKIHTDYRKLVATGMVYFSNQDDPGLSTYFYTSEQRDNPLRMETDFCHGWWHANGNNTYHDGLNNTNQTRYSCLLGLTLNVTPAASRS